MNVDKISEEYNVTDMQARIIDVLADDPDATNSDVAEIAEAPHSYVHRIRDKYSDIIYDEALRRESF